MRRRTELYSWLTLERAISTEKHQDKDCLEGSMIPYAMHWDQAFTDPQFI